jgi:uncharacterized protein (TIGR03790 family)
VLNQATTHGERRAHSPLSLSVATTLPSNRFRAARGAAALTTTLFALCVTCEESVAKTTFPIEGASDKTYQVPWDYIEPDQLLIVVNENDAQSVAVADEYMATYAIPAGNRLDLRFTKEEVLDDNEFQPIYRKIQDYLQNRSSIQGIVVTWTEPWKVAPPGDTVGMSITSAITFGFKPEYYNADHITCAVTAQSPLFGKELDAPWTDYGVRPTMMLAGETKQDVFELIQRSVDAKGTFPRTTGYLVRTTDDVRSVRYPQMEETDDFWTTPLGLKIDYIDNHNGNPNNNSIKNKNDVLYYFTGLAEVDHLETLQFMPGAVADHLTSSGGQLTHTSQMSILRWLEAGASGSYGTVAEPCNSTEKFPDVGMVIDRYYSGTTLMDAYWQSVKRPGEGIFVGDPLTRPYAPRARQMDGKQIEIATTGLKSGELYKVVGVRNDGTTVTIIDGLHVDKPELRVSQVPSVFADYRLVKTDITPSDHGKPVFETVTSVRLPNGATRYNVRATDGDRVSYAVQRSDGRLLSKSKDLYVQVVYDGDVDGNGSVNFEDLGQLKQAMYAVVGENNYKPEADLDNDGHVNMVDLGLLKQNFNGNRLTVYIHSKLDSPPELTIRAFDKWGTEATKKLKPTR